MLLSLHVLNTTSNYIVPVEEGREAESSRECFACFQKAFSSFDAAVDGGCGESQNSEELILIVQDGYFIKLARLAI